MNEHSSMHISFHIYDLTFVVGRDWMNVYVPKSPSLCYKCTQSASFFASVLTLIAITVALLVISLGFIAPPDHGSTYVVYTNNSSNAVYPNYEYIESNGDCFTISNEGDYKITCQSGNANNEIDKIYEFIDSEDGSCQGEFLIINKTDLSNLYSSRGEIGKVGCTSCKWILGYNYAAVPPLYAFYGLISSSILNLFFHIVIRLLCMGENCGVSKSIPSPKTPNERSEIEEGGTSYTLIEEEDTSKASSPFLFGITVSRRRKYLNDIINDIGPAETFVPLLYPNYVLFILKGIFYTCLFVFLTLSVLDLQNNSVWDKYERIGFLLLNSGLPRFILDSYFLRNGIPFFELIDALPVGDLDNGAEKNQSVGLHLVDENPGWLRNISLFISYIIPLSLLPWFASHVLPMALYFLWETVALLLFSVLLFVTMWAAQDMHDITTSKEERKKYSFSKFVNNFVLGISIALLFVLITISMQALFIQGVYIYKGEDYVQSIVEYNQSAWPECFMNFNQLTIINLLRESSIFLN